MQKKTDTEYKPWEKNTTTSKWKYKNNIKQTSNKTPEYTQKYEHNKIQSKSVLGIKQKKSKQKYEHKTVISSINPYSVWNKGSSSIIFPKEKKIKKSKSPPKVPKIIIPTRDSRNYAAIIKPEIKIDQYTFIPNTTTQNKINFPIPRIISRKWVTNSKPSSYSRNSSHVSWELAHYPILLKLYDIFMDGIYKLDPNFPENSDTFYNFTDFVYNVSSTYISSYLDDLTHTQEDDYILYTIKRQDFI